MITQSGNISTWRGKDTPPTTSHLWIKEDNDGKYIGTFIHDGTNWIDYISELDDVLQDIEDLKDELITINTSITNITNSITTIEGDITNIEGDIVDIQGDITNIQGDITTINGDITNIKSDITNIKGDIVDINTSITNIENHLDDIDADILVIVQDIIDIKTSITTINTKITNIEDSIDDINDEIINIKSDITDLQTALANEILRSTTADTKLQNEKQGKLVAGNGITLTPVSGSDYLVKIDADVIELFQIVEPLPATGENNIIYLVPRTEPSVYNEFYEYIWINDAWESLGPLKIDIDLTNYYTKSEVNALLNDKVDVDDFNLHVLDTDNPHEVTKVQVGLGNVDNTSDLNKPISTATQTALDTKVDKIVGKGLSTEDYTTVEKTKLAGIEEGAEVNVQSDWNAISGDAFILNKPNIVDNLISTQTSDVLSANQGRILKNTKLESVVAGSNVSIDSTNPLSPIISVTGIQFPSKFTSTEIISGVIGDELTGLDLTALTSLTGGATPIVDDIVIFPDGTQAQITDIVAPNYDATIVQIQQTVSWGTIEGTLSHQSDLNTVLDNKVDKIVGKQLSTEDFTSAEKTKLAGIATGAQVNVLEGVQVNGTDLAITNKKVNIDLSNYATLEDLGDDITVIEGNITNIQNDITTIEGDITDIKGDITTINNTISDIQTELDEKLDINNIIAGTNITLNKSGNNITINSKTPTWGDITGDIEDQDDLIELIDDKIAELDLDTELASKLEVTNIIQGTNITLSKTGNNVTISAANQVKSWGDITGTLSNQTDLNTILAGLTSRILALETELNTLRSKFVLH